MISLDMNNRRNHAQLGAAFQTSHAIKFENPACFSFHQLCLAIWICIFTLGFHPAARRWSLPGNFNDMWNAIISLFSITVGLYQGDFREIQGAVERMVSHRGTGSNWSNHVEALGPIVRRCPAFVIRLEVIPCCWPWSICSSWCQWCCCSTCWLRSWIRPTNISTRTGTAWHWPPLGRHPGWVVDIVMSTMMNTSIQNS